MALTLYRLVDRERVLRDVEENAVVEVTSTHPGDPTGDDVLYELHPLPSLIEETDEEGVFRVPWGDALNWPHQLTAP